MKTNQAEDVPADVLRAAARQASLRAMRESRALGLTVTVFENGQLVRIHANGQREIVADEYRDTSGDA